MKNQKVLSIAALAGLAIGGLSATAASAQSSAEESTTTVEQTQSDTPQTEESETRGGDVDRQETEGDGGRLAIVAKRHLALAHKLGLRHRRSHPKPAQNGHIVTDSHASAEYNLAMTVTDASIDLPLHLVAELDGSCVSALRVYHSTYPLTGEHIARAPLVAPNSGLRPAPPVGAYEAAMAAGDPEALDALFEADGYVREPAGIAFKHQGAERMGFNGPAFSGGPVPLNLCTVIDDGAALAFEYVCDRWGPADLPAQAGSAVYVPSPTGLLEAVTYL